MSHLDNNASANVNPTENNEIEIDDHAPLWKAEDLVFVHNNLRLLSRKSPSYKEGVTQMWDIGGDRFDNLGEEGVGMLEIANLSLDEPSLEVALFTREDITNIVVD
ncbi:hypothetical protein L3X38_017652 [Prunus dulcis]|uniref:Uncharacterized protein n=1 Tax=Prunus dulcis TaxID=3755 RepID=A0AAD4W897_PRUDU|nr:hypothetical protein L3X38_017652 [Prunus dulcis]